MASKFSGGGQDFGFLNGTNIIKIAVGVVLLFVAIFVTTNLVQSLDASHIMVIQYPSGTLVTHNTPGWKAQYFGKVTLYKKRHQFRFLADGKDNAALPTRFNDGGKAQISGSIQWEMPTAVAPLLELHAKYGSDEAIEQQLMNTVVSKAITMTGPLMSSTESYAARRNDLVSLILDQIQHGVYRTTVRQERVKDEMTGADKTVYSVNLVASTNVVDHGWQRQEQSPLDEFSLRAFNLTVNDVVYDEAVTGQIKQQQAAIMQVQTAMANAKQAEQQAITAEKNGEAEAAKAKWDQEVLKATAVTEAEQIRDVAKLKAEAAEHTKRQLILEGEGEAEKRKLIMNADGALAVKVEAYKYAVDRFATAIEKYQGNWVPTYVMGGGNGTSGVAGSGAFDLMQLLTIKTARDLSLDIGAKKQ